MIFRTDGSKISHDRKTKDQKVDDQYEIGVKVSLEGPRAKAAGYCCECGSFETHSKTSIGERAVDSGAFEPVQLEFQTIAGDRIWNRVGRVE